MWALSSRLGTPPTWRRDATEWLASVTLGRPADQPRTNPKVPHGVDRADDTAHLVDESLANSRGDARFTFGSVVRGSTRKDWVVG